MTHKHNTSGSFVKILLGAGLTILIFMSYMLAEQRGWVNTNIADRILRGVEDGKAIRESQNTPEAKKANPKAPSDEKIFGETVSAPVPEPKTEPAPATPENSTEDSSDDFGDDGFSDENSTDDSSDDTSSEDSADTAAKEETPKTAPKPAKPKKLNYEEISRKRGTWPKAVQMRVKGTMVSLFDKNGVEVTKIEVPVGTRLFVRKVTSRGVLEVKNAVNGQIFQVHASRTTFSRVYTGKPISDGLVASSGDSAGSSGSSVSEDDSDSSDSDDSDDSDDSSDDFSDDDFFDDDF